jgi:hypothetical protein
MEHFLITKTDINKIVSDAKNEMFKLNLPIYISNKEVHQTELVTIAVLEAVLMYLNNKKLLTNLVLVDYTNVVSQYDPEFVVSEEEKE